MRTLAISLFISLAMAGMAEAQPACPAASASTVEIRAATASPELEPARLLLEQTATVALQPVNEVRFAAPPQKRADASSYGGMLTVDVREAGTYQVSLSAGAWVDVLKDGAALASTAHDHGAECSGLRKMVSFALQPGRHVIQISGNKEDTIQVMVARK